MRVSRGPHLELTEWPPSRAVSGAEPLVTLDEVQRNHVIAVLEATNWRVSGQHGAAEILGLKPTTLEARMKKLGIDRPS